MTQTNTDIQNLLVIDNQVADWQSLISGIGADTAVLVLDSGSDGLTQISDYLASLAGQDLPLLQSIQIISHGGTGSLQLGSTPITQSSLSSYAKQLTKIGSALTATGDILLYGCNVAAGQIGLDFINQLSMLTNADVAASNDSTGSATLNGNWQLEASTGAIEATLALKNNTVNNFAGVLVAALPTVSITADVMPEEGSTIGIYTVTLDRAAPINGLTVYYTLSGTATLNTDYTISAGTNISDIATGSFTIAPGQTTATLAINAISDGLIDPNETIKLSLNPDVGYHSTNYFELAFNPKIDLVAGINPSSLCVGDFNGDGQTDIAVANYGSNSISVMLRNTPNTAFDNKIDLITGQNPSSIGVGDFNGDGKTDIAVTNWGSSTVSLFLRNTDNTGFDNKIDIAAGQYTNSLCTGDFNGDGKIDLAVTDNFNNTLSLLLRNTANTGFDPKVDFATGASLYSVGTADFNGDGKLDIATANSGNYSGSVSLFLRNTDNTGFDNKIDIAAGQYTNSLCTGDFNGDGKIDLAFTNLGSATVSVLLRNTANNGFELAVDYTTGLSPISVTSSDYNGDGKVDLVVANGNSNTLSVFLRNVSNTGFDPKVDFATGATPYSVGTADFNGDGKADLAVANYIDNTVSVFPNNTILPSTLNITDHNPPNIVPTMTAFAAPVTTGNEDTQITISFADLMAQSNVIDVDGSITGFVIKAVSGGSLIIATAAEMASPLEVALPWNALTNNTVDATHQAYWIPNFNANGSLNAFTAVAKDNGGFESTTPVQVKVTVTPVNDLPTGTVTISGVATQNQTLTAHNTLADIDGLGGIAYQWFANNVLINGASTATLKLGQAQVGKTITVKASYTDLQGTAENKISLPTSAVININDAPTGDVSITGIAEQNQILVASNTLADIDGLGVIRYAWFADGNIITGATGSNLLLKQAEVGKVISVTESYTDLQGTLESVSSLSTTSVANVNDLPTGGIAIFGVAADQFLSIATNTLNDLDGLGTFYYQWFADEIAIDGATDSTLLLSQALLGKNITVQVGYTDVLGTPESVLSNLIHVNALPSGDVTITGTAIQNQTLIANNTLADIDGLGPINYQWFANEIAIDGAVTSTLTLSQALVDKAITVTASYIDQFGTPESLSSLPTNPVVNVNDIPTGGVYINGVATQNQLLIASNNLADFDGLGDITYQWLANNQIISGATSDTIKLSQDQIGKNITVKASYIDLQGTHENSISAATSAVLVGDTTAPIISAFNPNDSSQTVSINTNISIIFNEAVQRGNGVISIHTGSANGPIIESFDASSSDRLNYSGNTLTIDPTYFLDYGTHYFVTFSAGSIADLSGNNYIDSGSYDFTTKNLSIYNTIDYLPDLSISERLIAPTLSFNPYTDSSSKGWDNQAIYSTFNAYAILNETFFWTGIEGASYDIFSWSYFDPYLIEIYDQFGHVLSVSTEHSYDIYGMDYIFDFVAPYTGTYYVSAGWNQGISDSFVMLSMYENVDTIPLLDTTAPYITNLIPTNDLNGISVTTNITLSFNEAIQKGNGFITLHQNSALGEVVESFDVASSNRLTVVGNSLLINPTNNLLGNTQYFINVDSGNVKDLSGNSYSGLASYSFTTAMPPVISTFNPVNQAVAVSTSRNIVITFNEAIQKGVGTITIYQDSLNGKVFEKYNTESNTVNLSISNTILTINPSKNLLANTQYFISIDDGSITNLDTNSFAGLNNYGFRTAINILDGTIKNDNTYGSAGDDQISGLKGNDILDGGLGIDTLIGGLGNDIYIIDSTTDTITELVNQGTDIVKSSVSFSLENIFNLENLTLTGNSSINGTGNSLKNVITGNSNSNQLDGGLGNDTLVGGFGDDTYVVDSLSDVVTEKALQGNDTIVTSNLKTYSLSKLGNVENLIYTGSESAKLTGNGLDNSLMGSILNDTLIGGLGNDTLTGGSGADHFVINTKLNGLTNVDTIAAFEVGIDKIDLSIAIFKTVGAKGVLNADAFNSGDFIGGQNPTDRIIYNTTTGALYYDVDGSGTKSSVQIAVIGIDSHANLTNTDFLIIA